MYISHEKSFDEFHKNEENIYVNYVVQNGGDQTTKMAYTPLPLAVSLKQEIPEIENTARFVTQEITVRNENKVFTEKGSFTDPSFLYMFSFPMLYGNPNTALSQLNDIVITPAIAEKYFGTEDPIGKKLSINIFSKEENFIVSDVIQKPPSNSSLDFDILLRVEKRPFYEKSITQWGSFQISTFVQLNKKANLQMLQPKLDAFTNTHFAKLINNVKERTKGKVAKPYEIKLLPIKDLHFTNDINWENSIDPTRLYILSAIALLILIIACINYISLAISSASGRTKEVGIRKVAGAYRTQLMKQFWAEALLMGFISLALSILFVQLILPLFNQLTDRNFTINQTNIINILSFLVSVIFVISLITGGYPALHLSSFKPAAVLKGRNTYRFKTGLIKGLVVVQYALSAFLLISALVMYRQMKYVSNKDLGYNKDQLIILPTHTGFDSSGEILMNQMRASLAADPNILSVSGASSPPDNYSWSLNGFTVDGKDRLAYLYKVDYDFIKTIGAKIIEGRDFSRSYATDYDDAVIVNEAMVKYMGWKNPVGQKFSFSGDDKNSTVIGVVKDYNFLSLESEVGPMILYLKNYDYIYNLLIKIKPHDFPATLASLERTWKSVVPDKPFDYHFQDEAVQKQYQQYQRWLTVMTASTIIAVPIACMGLFGLAGIMAVNKTKEIGIRKVFGASTKNVMVLLNKDIVKLAIVSFFIAIPVAWWIMQKWLENFAYRIYITADIPILAVVSTFLIALFTVSYYTLKASFENPEKSLRTE